MKKRLPVLVMLGVGLVLWRTGLFGFLPTEHTLVGVSLSYGGSQTRTSGVGCARALKREG